MAQHRSTFPVEMMSKLLGVSKSGFYDWRKRQPSRRAREDADLTRLLQQIFEQSKQTYGRPRLHRELRRLGYRVSAKRVGKLAKRAGIRPISQKKFKTRTTDSRHSLPISANLLRRDFSAERPDQVWVSDITYVRVKTGCAYLCTILDLYSRKVVGWSVAMNMKVDLVRQTLAKALGNRTVAPWELTFHSDRGSQYASRAFREELKRHKIKSSMSRTGDCFDNAVAESFFGTLKTERLCHRQYADLEELRLDLFAYIDGFYNRRRMHSYLDYMSPDDFERRVEAA